MLFWSGEELWWDGLPRVDIYFQKVECRWLNVLATQRRLFWSTSTNVPQNFAFMSSCQKRPHDGARTYSKLDELKIWRGKGGAVTGSRNPATTGLRKTEDSVDMSNALTLISLNSPLQFSIHFAGTWKPFRTTLPAFQDTILACNSNAPNRTTQLQHGLAQASINPRPSNETSPGFSQGFPTWWLNSPIVFPHPLASLSGRNQARLATRLAMRHPWHLPNLQPSHSKSQCLRGSGQSSMAAYLRCASKSSKDPLWSTWLCSILDQDNTKRPRAFTPPLGSAASKFQHVRKASCLSVTCFSWCLCQSGMGGHIGLRKSKPSGSVFLT